MKIRMRASRNKSINIICNKIYLFHSFIKLIVLQYLYVGVTAGWVKIWPQRLGQQTRLEITRTSRNKSID